MENEDNFDMERLEEEHAEEADKIFDDDALAVMQANAEVLRQAEEASKGNTATGKEVEFRFDLVTPRDRAKEGCAAEIDVRQAVEMALKQQGNDAMPSKTCYLESISLEDVHNTLPCAVKVVCKQKGRTLGTFLQGKVKGQESEHSGDACLYVAHAGASVHLAAGRQIYKASNFVEGPTARKYLKALKHDVADSITPINKSKSVEYASPHAEITPDNVKNGDWFVNVMYTNPTSFKHMVQGVRTPSASGDQYQINLRMHADDFDVLHSAVNSHIIQPLRAHLMDLDGDCKLNFVMLPSTVAAEDAAPDSLLHQARRSGADVWRAKDLVASGGGFAMTVRAVVKFV